MVPLFKSVGYQLIYHTFTEKCELSNSNLIELRPSTFFLAPAGIAKNPPPPGCANFPPTNMFSAISNDKIILQ